MEPITLQQLQNMFAGLHAETDWNLDGEMLWGYDFTSADPEVLEKLAEALDQKGFDPVEIFENEGEPGFILHVERIEKHTPESLLALNNELEALAKGFQGVEYDGMDVNSPDGEGEDEEFEGCSCHEEGVSEGCCGGEGDCRCDEDGGGHGDGGCCGGGEGHGCCGGSRHYHGEHEPITNPELLTAIETISGDRSPEAQQGLTIALQRGLYLVPVFAGRLDTEPVDDESLQVLVCSDDSGNEYLPLFTDEDALKAWTTENVSAMVLTAPEAWEFILSQPECAGGVVNPGDKALPLNREMVGLLKKMIDGSAA